jgi:hypothetical protein
MRKLRAELQSMGGMRKVQPAGGPPDYVSACRGKMIYSILLPAMIDDRYLACISGRSFPIADSLDAIFGNSL